MHKKNVFYKSETTKVHNRLTPVLHPPTESTHAVRHQLHRVPSERGNPGHIFAADPPLDHHKQTAATEPAQPSLIVIIGLNHLIAFLPSNPKAELSALTLMIITNSDIDLRFIIPNSSFRHCNWDGVFRASRREGTAVVHRSGSLCLGGSSFGRTGGSPINIRKGYLFITTFTCKLGGARTISVLGLGFVLGNCVAFVLRLIRGLTFEGSALSLVGHLRHSCLPFWPFGSEFGIIRSRPLEFGSVGPVLILRFSLVMDERLPDIFNIVFSFRIKGRFTGNILHWTVEILSVHSWGLFGRVLHIIGGLKGSRIIVSLLHLIGWCWRVVSLNAVRTIEVLVGRMALKLSPLVGWASVDSWNQAKKVPQVQISHTHFVSYLSCLTFWVIRETRPCVLAVARLFVNIIKFILELLFNYSFGSVIHTDKTQFYNLILKKASQEMEKFHYFKICKKSS